MIKMWTRNLCQPDILGGLVSPKASKSCILSAQIRLIGHLIMRTKL